MKLKYKKLLLIVMLALVAILATGCIPTFASGEAVDDYQKRLSQFISFNNEVFEIEERYFININDLIVKFNNEIENPEKQIPHVMALLEKYNTWYDDMAEVKVPEGLMAVYSYKLEFLEKQRLACINYADTIEYNDPSGLKDFDILTSEARTADIKASKEREIIMQRFNDEAEKLGLKTPFSNMD